MSPSRRLIALAAVLAATSLAGCRSEQAPTARSIQSLDPQTVSLMQEKGMTRSDPILMRIYKEESKAEIWKKRKADGKYALLKTYDICRFSGGLGPKLKEGDKQAPEGFYSVTPAQMNPRSSYYLSFNIGFPNRYDQALGRTGRHVMVHGDCLSAGCYAMTDPQIAEIYALARESFAGGQKAFQVQALPFRMTPQNMARRRDNKNIAFWKNLKQGSDHFEVTKLEPKVDACGKKYVFNASAGGLSSFEPTAQCPSFQVQPQIAQAVAAKERADNLVIAQLSKIETPAPDYIAQNGRLRRKLDEPIIQVASVTPAMSPLPLDGAQAMTLSRSTSTAEANRAVAFEPSPVAGDASAKGGAFTRMFRDEPSPATQPPAVAATPYAPVSAAPATTASTSPAAKPARSAPREIAPQAPVMASSVGEAPVQLRPAQEGWAPASRLRGWVGEVGGLFGVGGKPAEAAPAPAAATAPSPVVRAPGRSASAPSPRQSPDARLAAYAAQ